MLGDVNIIDLDFIIFQKVGKLHGFLLLFPIVIVS